MSLESLKTEETEERRPENRKYFRDKMQLQKANIYYIYLFSFELGLTLPKKWSWKSEKYSFFITI